MYNAKVLIFKTHFLGIIAPNIINLRVSGYIKSDHFINYYQDNSYET